MDVGVDVGGGGGVDDVVDVPTSIDDAAPAAIGGQRVKRKSGKTTGALSRPKGASDSGSKSTSRKKDGECFFGF